MKPGAGKKVLLAMSGGVDSSVAAVLLNDDGYEVVGCFMRLGGRGADDPVTDSDSGEQRQRGCCSVGDAADARLVGAVLDIPLYVLNFTDQFDRVIRYFVAEYNAGRTPNPCVRCNDWLKFGSLLDYADTIAAEYVATGHYARIDPGRGHRHADAGRPRLLRGRDHDKDQSYVLFGTRRDRLARMVLPVGEYRKDEIRAIARQHGLAVADKPDSQEICFVPDDDYAAVVRRHAPDSVRPGDVLDHEGNRLGQHQGHQHFTIGQRRGIGVAVGEPAYVLDRDASSNTITIGPKQHLLAGGLRARDTNWLIAPPRDAPLHCQVKIRYGSQPVPARVTAGSEDDLEVHFERPVSAVAPGQAVVCYDGDEVLGGGWIEQGLAPVEAPGQHSSDQP